MSADTRARVVYYDLGVNKTILCARADPEASGLCRYTNRGPRRGVRAKAGLNREILASGWGILVRRLEEKSPGRVEKINPAHTSQRCSACGHVAGENRKSQAVFACTACRYTANADVNAATNIAAGHAVTARGGLPLGGPANREPSPLSSRHRQRAGIPAPNDGEDVKQVTLARRCRRRCRMAGPGPGFV